MNIVVKSTLPRSASAEDKLNEIINQLQQKYQGRTVYFLWEIKKENREVNFDTVAKWVKVVNGSTLSDYLVSKGILTPVQYFDVVEKDVSVEDLKGKNVARLVTTEAFTYSCKIICLNAVLLLFPQIVAK